MLPPPTDAAAAHPAEQARLAALARHTTNLADARLGAVGISCTDQFFAPLSRMLEPTEPVFIPDKYDAHGKWMDGWESRRRRGGGHDQCVVRLAARGEIHAVDIDTRYFTGNYPPAASLEGCLSDGDPDAASEWRTLLPEVALGADAHHLFAVAAGAAGAAGGVYSHVRLNILPDGGVARLRVYGRPRPDWQALAASGAVDLASALTGAMAVAWNDSHYGQPGNLLRPDRARDAGDGWETRRRREPGHDWCIIALSHPGAITRVVIDTAHFKGNYPDRCSLQGALLAEPPAAATAMATGAGATAGTATGTEAATATAATAGAAAATAGATAPARAAATVPATTAGATAGTAAPTGAAGGGLDDALLEQAAHWPELLPQQRLQADREHTFTVADGVRAVPVSHVRLNLFPDGGVSRVRLFGTLAFGASEPALLPGRRTVGRGGGAARDGAISGDDGGGGVSGDTRTGGMSGDATGGDATGHGAAGHGGAAHDGGATGVGELPPPGRPLARAMLPAGRPLARAILPAARSLAAATGWARRDASP